MARAYRRTAVSPERRRAVPGAMRDRDRLVPPRPARARSPGADRGPPRGRAGRARVRARPAPARRRALPVAPTARGSCWRRCASCARRCASAAASCSCGRGRPEHVLPRLARETGAEAVHFASDVSPFAMARDRRVIAALGDVAVRRTPGNFVADVGAPRTKDGRPFAVFSPFHRAWEQLPRRAVHGAPRRCSVPAGLDPGAIPDGPGRPRPPSRSRPARRPRASALRAGSPTASSATPTATTGSPAARRSCRRTCTSAACRRARSRSGRARRAARARRRSCASSPGATSTRTSCCTTRATPAAPTSRSSTRSSGRTTPDALEAWRAGRTGYPGRRRRRCASSCTRAGCTTARG